MSFRTGSTVGEGQERPCRANNCSVYINIYMYVCMCIRVYMQEEVRGKCTQLWDILTYAGSDQRTHPVGCTLLVPLALSSNTGMACSQGPHDVKGFWLLFLTIVLAVIVVKSTDQTKFILDREAIRNDLERTHVRQRPVHFITNNNRHSYVPYMYIPYKCMKKE